MTPGPLRTVAVVGGGIGGLTAAIALQQRGIDVHVYEAAPALGRVGKGIWLPTNAMLVMARLGLAARLAARGIPLARLEIHDARAGLLQAVDLAPVQRELGHTTTSILRADLQAVLVEALAPGRLHLGRRAVAVADQGEQAIVTFADRSQAAADLVVGADGLRSLVRGAVVGDVPLRYAGQTCYLGVADYPLPGDLLRTVREIWGGSNRFGFSAVGEERVYWFAPRTAPAGGPLPDRPGDLLRERYRDFPAPVGDILAHTADAQIIRVDLHDIRPLPRWHRGRILLLGDAAHAMTPNLGQGGAQAIEDAWFLAAALSAGEPLPDALARYQRQRRPRAGRIAATAWRLGQVAHLAHPLGRRLRNTAMRLIPRGAGQGQATAVYRVEWP